MLFKNGRLVEVVKVVVNKGDWSVLSILFFVCFGYIVLCFGCTLSVLLFEYWPDYWHEPSIAFSRRKTENKKVPNEFSDLYIVSPLMPLKSVFCHCIYLFIYLLVGHNLWLCLFPPFYFIYCPERKFHFIISNSHVKWSYNN